MSEALVAVDALSRAAEAIRQINQSCERELAPQRSQLPDDKPSCTLASEDVRHQIVHILRVEPDFGRVVIRLVDLVERVREGTITESRREFADYMDACARQLRTCPS